ncbi:alpha-lytic protease prodomain-containing protein [Microtetraspora niveoalba]|uniref:alpha-lytic protease prodomain-containing protein n=1 Tax=Microtetraspora niveoalba TaxID=46175 RepID=UPI000831243C|nr:alpha-lytic protease prodomain-containing protein [Microtetraspora niveoalba]
MLRRHSVIAGCALTVAALAFPATTALAQPSTPSQETYAAQPAPQPPPGVAEAMQRDLGLSAEQARTRLANEQRAGQTEAALRAGLADNFGGSWLSGPTASLVVATTDANAVSGIVATGAEAKVVKHSLASLNATKEALDRASAKAPGTAPVWYVDVRTNSVVVLSSEPAKAEAFVAASGADRSLVRVEKSAEQPRPLYDLRGGDAYYIGSGTRCSIGFPVTRGATQGFVTAGHCGTTGSSTSGYNRVAQGTFQGSSFPGNDYAWVAANSNWTARPWVYSNGANLPVRGANVAIEGASVCRSGSTTGWHCGTVLQRNSSVTYQQGTVYEVTRTNVCAEPGDSGGSFISGDQAQGVTSGGTGNCGSGGVTYFQPVGEILATYGLTLTVEGGGGNPSPSPSIPPGGTTWQAGTSYAAGATVTYGGVSYRCLQGHTSITGWEPPNVPALWQRI